ncbi:MCE family protein [Nocardia bovistercoris]|uniref:MCE family protein n=1 Tax=Nocardia bovistercoris TaxID=2785916 RepID=A0A931N3I7_9NOCA|nr:MCE family protein [Nocardia bovistercoris]MBH0776603.1 MCE family protein [Nocardia bovistercoris]
MSYRRSLLGLIAFLVVSILTTWTVFVTLERGVRGDVDRYSAVFTDVSGLQTGDDVRVAGVRVGRVDDIELAGTRAKVTFAVRDEQRIYGNTVASIVYQNVIGQRYLGLSLGEFHDPSVLRPGSLIPLEHTEPSFDLSNLLNGFEPLFGLLEPEQVDNVTEALIRGLQGDNGSITALIAQTSALAESFAGPDEVLGAVIDNLGKVVADLARQGDNLQTTIAQTRKIFEGLDQQRDIVLRQVGDISTVLDRAAQVVRGSAPELSAFITRRPGFVQHFLDNKGKFAYLGFNVPLLLKGMARIADDGAYVNAYACNVEASVIPGGDSLLEQLVGAATPGGAPENSAICR